MQNILIVKWVAEMLSFGIYKTPFFIFRSRHLMFSKLFLMIII